MSEIIKETRHGFLIYPAFRTENNNVGKIGSSYHIQKEYINIQIIKNIKDLDMIVYFNDIKMIKLHKDEVESLGLEGLYYQIDMPYFNSNTLDEYFNKFKDSDISLDEWVQLGQELCHLYNQIHTLNKKYDVYHNGIIEENIIYNGRYLHLVDFEYVTQGELTLIGRDNDLFSMTLIIDRLINIGFRNIEIREILNNKNIESYRDFKNKTPEEIHENCNRLCSLLFTPIVQHK